MNGVPTWAERIIRTVASENRRKVPTVSWRPYRTHVRTAGSADGDGNISLTSLRVERTKITVPGVHCDRVARRELSDAKRVLLHELAHWLTDGEGHTERFWITAFDLYRRFRVPMAAALRDEAAYKQGALTGYWAGRDRRGRRPTNKVKITTTVNAGPPEGR